MTYVLFYLCNIVLSACGHFLYFEASSFANGVVLSPPFTSSSGEMCLQFSLSMYSISNSMGIIYVSVVEGNSHSTFWNSYSTSYTGPMEWKKIQVNLPNLSTTASYKVCVLYVSLSLENVTLPTKIKLLNYIFIGDV